MSRPVCTQCQRPLTVCYCHTLERVDNHWPVFIWQHPSEQHHAIGTARMAALSLSRCRLHCRAIMNERDATTRQWIAERPLLVYPADHSFELTEFVDLPPRPLLFLDGSWRKTRRMVFESPWLQQLPAVRLRPQERSNYRIRKAPASDSLSTIEAVVAALSTLERDTTKYQPLLNSFAWMIDQQIQRMGRDTFERYYPTATDC